MKKVKFVPLSKYTIDELVAELNELANCIEVTFDMPENAELIDRAIVLLKKHDKCQNKRKIPAAKKQLKQAASVQ